MNTELIYNGDFYIFHFEYSEIDLDALHQKFKEVQEILSPALVVALPYGTSIQKMSKGDLVCYLRDLLKQIEE